MNSTDVAIVGAGPAGSTVAQFIQMAGLKATLVDKDESPRFRIGESFSGEVRPLLRELGLEEEMLRRKHPVKRGVKVYGPNNRNSFYVPVMARTERGLEEAHTWQVRRSDFDQMMLEAAKKRGAEHLRATVTDVLKDRDRVVGLKVVQPDGTAEEIRSRVVVDASGLSGFLATRGLTSERVRGDYDKQVALFGHFKSALRDDTPAPADTVILYSRRDFWAWFIPIDEEKVSVGIVVPGEYFKSKGETKQAFFHREVLELHPELARRLAGATLVAEVRAIANYSFAVTRFTGKGYLCVGDSHRFIDPIFSFGVYFSMKEAKFASEAIIRLIEHGEGAALENPFEEYERLCNHGMNAVNEMIDAFWNHPLAFSVFAHQRYREDLIDLFAGRVYAPNPSRGLVALRELNASSTVHGPQAKTG